MGLAEILADPAVAKRSRRTSSECPIRTAMRDMNERDRQALEEVFITRSVTVQNIFRALSADGYSSIAQWHVKEHAAKRCACYLVGKI